MAETLREPAALSPDSGNFPRGMRTARKRIRKAGSAFRPAGNDVRSFEKTAAGAEAERTRRGHGMPGGTAKRKSPGGASSMKSGRG